MIKGLRVIVPVLVCSSMLVLSGCGSKSKTDEEMQAKNGEAMSVEEPLDSKAMGIGEGRTTEGMLPVYFNFDSAEIRADQVSRIEVNAEFIKNLSEQGVRIEGNTDSRGTKEYNMALGERRALSTKKYLINLGVDAANLTTVSYGEERMLLQGNDEVSWAQNRRADFVVIQ